MVAAMVRALGILLPILMLMLAGQALAQDAPERPCGTQPINIARMQWPSAAILAEIHARILTAEVGCVARTIPGDLGTTASSMTTTGQPAAAPEMWITRIPEVWNAAVNADAVRQVGGSYEAGAFEGWFVPDYFAAAHPEITSAASLAANAAAFAAPGQRPRLISCPPDWACSVINRNLATAQGIGSLFEIVEPANRFEMDQLIAQAVSRQQPLVFYYWQPNAILAQFGFVPLDMGEFDEEAFACLGQRACPSPAPTSFFAEPVVTAIAEWVFDDAPRVAQYFGRAKMPVEEMNALLLKLSEPGMTAETVADGFVAERSDIWTPWLGE